MLKGVQTIRFKGDNDAFVKKACECALEGHVVVCSPTYNITLVVMSAVHTAFQEAGHKCVKQRGVNAMVYQGQYGGHRLAFFTTAVMAEVQGLKDGLGSGDVTFLIHPGVSSIIPAGVVR